MREFSWKLTCVFLCVLQSVPVKTQSAYSSSFCDYYCPNGDCIPEHWLCDGFNDCGDFVDEMNCECSSDQFECDNGVCIYSSWECDSENDCGDWSDEHEDCPVECESDDYICPDGTCIYEGLTCDHFNDCNDWADEMIPGCNFECLPEEFRCGDDFCVSPYWVCDGEDDCLDASDESIVACESSPLCGGELTDVTGTISSPNFPLDYPNAAKCTWIIRGAEGTSVELEFTSFALEEPFNYQGALYCFDWIEIRDGMSDEDSYVNCGFQTPPPYATTGNILWIQFVSDRIDTEYGFNATYRIVCQGVFCYNGGTCLPLETDVMCLCPSQYTGQNCETAIDPCQNVVCRNGGTCVNNNGVVRCECQSGFQGQNCETAIDPCRDMICHNGGTCVNNYGVASCECQSGFQGQNCEIAIDPCQNVVCHNGGTCVNNNGVARCDCQFGFQGQNCETAIDPCQNMICHNGGTCVHNYGVAGCECQSGFQGQNCETDLCQDMICHNGGTCVSNNGVTRCECKSAFQGHNCETVTTSLVASSEIILEEEFVPALLNSTSKEYQNFKNDFEILMNEILSQSFDAFERCEVTGLRKGSVVVDFDVHFNQLAEDVTGALEAAITEGTESGSLGRFTVQAGSVSVWSPQVGSDGCEHPGSIENGFVIPDQSEPYNFGQKVEFACREPFMLDGNHEAYCKNDKVWSHRTPKCVEEDEGNFFEDNLPIIAAAGGGVIAIILIIVLVVVCRKQKSNSADANRPESTVYFVPERENPDRGGNTYDPKLASRLAPQQVNIVNPGYHGTLSNRPPVPSPRPKQATDDIYETIGGLSTVEARRAAFQKNNASPEYIDPTDGDLGKPPAYSYK